MIMSVVKTYCIFKICILNTSTIELYFTIIVHGKMHPECARGSTGLESLADCTIRWNSVNRKMTET